MTIINNSNDGTISQITKRFKRKKESSQRKIEIDCNKNSSIDCNNNNIEHQQQQQQQPTKYISNWISTTKYTILTFIPKNLFEQFRRVANLYFLFILIISYTPVSPVAPGPSTINLGIVLLINAVKEAYEDFRRYQSDKRINYQSTKVIRNSKLIDIFWKDLEVGDVVRVDSDEQFPADLVLLSSSSESPGMCYVETSNLDGESNLKSKQSLVETNNLKSVEDFIGAKLLIEYETPSHLLNKFDGRITINNEDTLPLNVEQLLVRGTQLKNTKWIYGVVVYTGHETKYMLNTMATPSKKNLYICCIVFHDRSNITVCHDGDCQSFPGDFNQSR
ncbi:hypothetical protein PPL_12462 [Heterostelium album PN500]|uniref:P-type ATPase N-terminal domain-containing protein n=1 Tax=Heterostelium pallidum (strain ATCC 26659 / Pp 5 / PN500) TaxID=670386 RepID=D3BMN9_HETP5|nr:hypothetical protein PPL_12462 [Heterostelium album PN500]EFA77251.1 hypothetical protein PPL_12462 [Heterostelium album PN500]|eukprot:XP_020429380.1 hypothetical protein PPL_12462 [Heterostelium album PN500]